MDNITILETAERYMDGFLEASKNNAAAYTPRNKETILAIIQNFKSSTIGIYSFAHDLIYKNGNKDETMPPLNELEALWCDTYKPAFDKLLREVRTK